MTDAQVETKQFQAETRKVLDIVINSLYTERDIFVRELVSNAADALEKFRHQSLIDKIEFDAHVPLEITIDCDDKKHILTIADTGIGMTREELETNLGTIAHSGSKHFFEQLAEAAKKDVNLIGQFGVGFYSVFMAAKAVRVQTRSWDGGDGWEWASDGGGTYTLSPCPGLHRGTKIIIELKDDAHTYASKFTIERIIQQYSTFVPFPVKVEGKTVNTVQAIWTRSKSEITDEEYTEFYKFIGNAVDDPMYRLHFSADAPLAINALVYVPKENFEVLGMGRMQPGVNLYCQKVLIDQHSENILPEWLRFLKGVVDSEDLPLNISRQSLQDNALVLKLRKVLTKRVIKFLAEEAERDADKYREFWKTFGIFLKEGVTSDFEHRTELAKLLRFESSASEPGTMISLDEYVGRMREGQDKIYYINGPSRAAVEYGPYVEMFKKRGIEIFYTLEPIDDFVLNHLGEYNGKKLVSADRADLSLPETTPAASEEGAKESGEPLAEAVMTSLCRWMKEVLGDRIQEVKASSRLVDSPAMIVNVDGYMTSSMERILKASGQTEAFGMGSKKDMEINAKSPLIKQLAGLRESDGDFARDVVEQLYDNAMIQAGLLVDPMVMVQRNYRILERVTGKTAPAA
ncbi:Heat shock protein Hsp90 [Desulfobulbus propionicus DSM 2032]|jgi:molecular chaperone HtpG|uniref:Chaperone protein HtpG n=1 Tax=Desulfobulbus propionicus (strain ATCC 33891 / DSM 2032 / VKM B-1956 / 1pr3) TaxID=577650 RepID=A0A7U3YK15_DESPD|nr:molecular chaperone HtpG [Desulfobulbus propionicus]ADW16819.1 Heat shock protein Hsp90 [Desulfobulbus propionicus DSM 2032]